MECFLLLVGVLVMQGGPLTFGFPVGQCDYAVWRVWGVRAFRSQGDILFSDVGHPFCRVSLKTLDYVTSTWQRMQTQHSTWTHDLLRHMHYYIFRTLQLLYFSPLFFVFILLPVRKLVSYCRLLQMLKRIFIKITTYCKKKSLIRTFSTFNT